MISILLRILKLLQQNSRLTVKELAARVHLSPSPTFERQKRLEREGYIQRYGAIVDHHKMGHNVIVLCNIRLKQHTHDLIQQFMDTVQTIDQITECYNTTGDYDFQIKVYARDMKAYQDFMLNTLGNILGGRPFKLWAYQNALNPNLSTDYDTLLYLDLYLDEEHDGDDIANQLADNSSMDYSGDDDLNKILDNAGKLEVATDVQ